MGRRECGSSLFPSSSRVSRKLICKRIQARLREEKAKRGKEENIGSDSYSEKNIDVIAADNSENSFACSVVSETQTGLSDESVFSVEKVKNANIDNPNVCEGRRIVDLSFLISEIQRVFTEHSRGIECRFADWKLQKTIRRGLLTQLFFRCDMCHYESSVWSEPTDDVDMLNVNKAAVVGSVTTGIGYSQAEQFLAAMNIPCMSTKTFSKCMDETIDDFTKTAMSEMKAAGEAEKQIAVANGEIIDGIPYITVVVDGSWSKRSYGTNYNSLSGIGAIVGYRTGKILFVGIRNKYCAICDRKISLSSDNHPRPHKCFKNFDRNKTSASMESDSIVEGFKSSIEMHGLIYRTFIADGDSNVHKSIRDNDPYKEQMVQVEKIECTNHLLRNLCKKLRVVSEMTQPKGQRKAGFYQMRNLIKNSILKIREAVESAAASRRKENSSRLQKESELQKDILNIPKHLFGEHHRCDNRAYSQTCNKSERNVIPYLKVHGLYAKIEIAIRYVAAHSASLIINATNNAAESFHAIICKYIAGKRINFGSRGSYNARVNAAVLQYNTQEALSGFYKGLCKSIPITVSTLENRRKEKVALNRENRPVTGRRTSVPNVTGDKNQYYGLQSEKPDLPKEVFDRLREDHYQKLSDNGQNAKNIERDTVDQVDSPLWMTIRRDMLTASNFGKICRRRDTTSCAGMVKEILYPPIIDTAAIHYGQENERNAREILMKKINKPIEKCGLFIDSKFPFLGASPDGLIDDDGLVEIKCPSSAENMSAEEAIQKIAHLKRIFVTKNDKLELNIRHKYYYQVQGQLHITNRQYCMFTVWTPKSSIVVKVDRNQEFWETEMKTKLIKFYEHCLLPEILDSRYIRNMSIRDPPFILEAQDKARKQKIEKEENSKTRKRKTCSIDSIPEIGQEEDCCIVKVCISEEKNDMQRQFLDAANASIENIEKNVLPIDGKLNDESLDKFLSIIRETSDFETQSVLYVAYNHFVKPISKFKSVQIIGGNCSDHWRCVSFDGCKIHVYDSLPSCTYEKLSKEEKEYISLRYPMVKISNIIFPKVQTQPDSWSCGIYAAAFATSIVLGFDPSKKTILL